jgi:hypothetical protein
MANPNSYDEVNENSTAYVDVTFLDGDGVAAQPSTAAYDLVDEKSGTSIKNDQPLTPTAGVVTITLDKTDNAILSAEGNGELRRLTVHATYGGGGNDEVHDEFFYRVKPLADVP